MLFRTLYYSSSLICVSKHSRAQAEPEKDGGHCISPERQINTNVDPKLVHPRVSDDKLKQNLDTQSSSNESSNTYSNTVGLNDESKQSENTDQGKTIQLSPSKSKSANENLQENLNLDNPTQSLPHQEPCQNKQEVYKSNRTHIAEFISILLIILLLAGAC